MSKLVDKARLAQLAKALDQRAKTAVEAEKTRAEGVESGLQNAINTINHSTTGVLAKAKEFTSSEVGKVNTTVNGLDEKITSLEGKNAELEGNIGTNASAIAKEVSDRTSAVSGVRDDLTAEVARAKAAEEANAEAISNEVTRAKAAEQANASAIATLNGAEDVVGSVSKKIKDAITPVKGELNTTKESVEALQTEVNANKTAITTGDAATLAEAKKYADGVISSLVNGAPEAMNTLKELADAITENEGTFDAYVQTVTSQLAGKVDKVAGSRLITEEEVTKFNAKAEVSAVNQAVTDSKAYTDEKIAEVNNANGNVVTRVDNLEIIVGKAADPEHQVEASGLIKEIADIKAKNTAQDGAISTAQTTADNAVSDAAAAKTQADKGVQDAAAAKTQADKGVQDAATAQSGVNKLKATVGDKSAGLVKDVNDAKAAIVEINHETTGILAKAKQHTNTEIGKVNTKIGELEGNISTNAEDIAQNTSDIAAEVTRAKAAEKQNADAITVLNGADSVAGSVANKIKSALAGYSNTEGVKSIISSVVGSLALSIDEDKVKLKLGGVEGVTVSETSLNLCTSEDIDAIIADLDKPAAALRR